MAMPHPASGVQADQNSAGPRKKAVSDAELRQLLTKMHFPSDTAEQCIVARKDMDRAMAGILENLDLPPIERKVLDRMRAGEVPAEILGITKVQRDALLSKGLRMIQAGQHQQARHWLMMLCVLNPCDARVVYAIGLTAQLQGAYRPALEVFARSIMLDPANPEAYLRTGECLLAMGEPKTALPGFEWAKRLCAQGRGNARVAAYANKMCVEVAAALASGTKH